MFQKKKTNKFTEMLNKTSISNQQCYLNKKTHATNICFTILQNKTYHNKNRHHQCYYTRRNCKHLKYFTQHINQHPLTLTTTQINCHPHSNSIASWYVFSIVSVCLWVSGCVCQHDNSCTI